MAFVKVQTVKTKEEIEKLKNPADVAAGIDASKIGMSKEAQKTATIAEIKQYQKTGVSPAAKRVLAATQQERLKKATSEAEYQASKMTGKETAGQVTRIARDIGGRYNVQPEQITEHLSRVSTMRRSPDQDIRPGTTAGQAVREARRIEMVTGAPTSPEMVRAVTESQMGIGSSRITFREQRETAPNSSYLEQQRQEAIANSNAKVLEAKQYYENVRVNLGQIYSKLGGQYNGNQSDGTGKASGNDSDGSNNLLASQTMEEGQSKIQRISSGGKRAVGTFANFYISPVKGFAKLVYGENLPGKEKVQSSFGITTPPKTDNKYKNWLDKQFRVEGPMYKDPDIVSAGIVSGGAFLMTIPVVKPVITTTYKILTSGQIVRTVANPTAENIGTSAALITPLALKKPLASLKDRFRQVEFTGEVFQKGDEFGAKGMSFSKNIGLFKGEARTWYEVKIPLKKQPVKWGEKLFDIKSEVTYTGTKKAYDIYLKGELASGRGKFIFTGKGEGKVSGSTGGEIFTIVGKEKGVSKLFFAEGVRGYKIKPFGKTESLFIKEEAFPYTEYLSQTSAYNIASASKLGKTKYIKSKKDLPKTTRKFIDELIFRYENPGKFYSLGGDIGRYTITRKSPVTVQTFSELEVPFPKGKKPEVIYQDIVPKSYLEKFQSGSTGAEETFKIGKADSKVAESFLRKFLPKKRPYVTAGDLFGVGMPVPQQGVLVTQPKLKPPKASFKLQPGTTAKDYASAILKSVPETKSGLLFGSPSINFSSKPDLISNLKPAMSVGLKPDLRFSLKPDIRIGLRPDLRFNLKPDIKIGLKPDIKIGLKPDIKIGLKPAVRVGLRPALKPLLRTSIRPTLRLTVPPPPQTTWRIPSFSFKGSKPAPPKKKKLGFKVPTGYTPSLWATVGGIKRKGKKRTFGGLGLRPN